MTTKVENLPATIRVEDLKQAADFIRRADGLIIAAGAGMGVDSGLPDFRGSQGLWRAYPALQHLNMDFEDIANSALFFDNPKLAWGFYGHRIGIYQNTSPHDGFHILKKWMAQKREGGWVYTSNVDHQFQKAGFDHQRILECHGSILRLQCSSPCQQTTWPIADFHPEVDISACTLLSPLPQCPYCGTVARPNVLLFNDHSWVNQTRQSENRFESWLPWLRKPLVIEIGAGEHVPSIRNATKRWMQNNHCRLIRINPKEYETNDPHSIGLQGNALNILTAIDSMMEE